MTKKLKNACLLVCVSLVNEKIEDATGSLVEQ
jgi:hypothetical protein